MSRYPGARWEPVAYTGLHARQPYKAALIHTNGSKGSDLKAWWDSCAAGKQGAADLHVGAQYQVLLDGTAYCYVDPGTVVYHAYGASEWAFAIEHQDNGDPEHTPFTPAQIATTAAILHFHGVPAKLLASASPADGVGFHQEFSAWNQSGHNCPGTVRRAQVSSQIIPALAALYQQEADVPLTPDDVAKVAAAVWAYSLPEVGSNKLSSAGTLLRYGEAYSGLGRVEITAQITALAGALGPTVQAAVEAALKNAVVNVDVNVDSKPPAS